MITTVCMNPSFDKTATVDKLALGQLNRLRDIRCDAGGKGINVAIALTRLHVETACVGFLGAENESAFLGLLEKDQLPFHYILLPQKTRTNFKLLELDSRTVTELNEPGPQIPESELTPFFSLLQREAQDSRYVVLSGKLPGGCPESTYQQCMKRLPKQQCVLDCEGESLLHGLREKPFLVKPNLLELEATVKKELRSLASIREGARFLLNHGAQNAIVSMGMHGAMLVTETEAFFAPALAVEAKSTVGAGDAMLAGVLAGLVRGESLCDSFRYGMAAGAASVMTEGTQLFHEADFEKLLSHVVVNKL